MNRRDFLMTSTASLLLPAFARAQAKKEKTKFQVACMTYVYSRFPFERALKGIKEAGYTYVALGTSHPVDGKNVSILSHNDPAAKAKEVGQKCRDSGLEPLMMFSNIYPENPMGLEILKNKLNQAAAAKIPQVLTF